MRARELDGLLARRAVLDAPVRAARRRHAQREHLARRRADEQQVRDVRERGQLLALDGRDVGEVEGVVHDCVRRYCAGAGVRDIKYDACGPCGRVRPRLRSERGRAATLRRKRVSTAARREREIAAGAACRRAASEGVSVGDFKFNLKLTMKWNEERIRVTIARVYASLSAVRLCVCSQLCTLNE